MSEDSCYVQDTYRERAHSDHRSRLSSRMVKMILQNTAIVIVCVSSNQAMPSCKAPILSA